MEKNLTIAQAQELVDQWIKTVGVRYFNELTNMTILMEEVGELVFRIQAPLLPGYAWVGYFVSSFLMG